ncbi:hypothetical protein KSP40_PGU013876 [Platanthera guangdongensis]|uniref:Uncharacterized protein n=1 Tax=Platanthera guangdongensis TaxID=2320717 RepID=A0ABR2LQX8_9ASPA
MSGRVFGKSLCRKQLASELGVVRPIRRVVHHQIVGLASSQVRSSVFSRTVDMSSLNFMNELSPDLHGSKAFMENNFLTVPKFCRQALIGISAIIIKN